MSSPTTLQWPGESRACVALAFDVDGPTGDAMLDGSIWRKPEYFGFGGYGPYRALPRILDLLDAVRIPATFFVPAWVVENWPRQCQAIVERGHEVAYHGYRHESFYALEPQVQRQVMDKCREVFWTLLGVRAEGFRTPSGDWHAHTPAVLLEAGVTYSSSMRGDDRPYLINVAGYTRPLVEIPGHWELDDYASLAYTKRPDFPCGLDRTASYELTLDNWCREFDGAMDEGLCLTTLLHPKIIGKPGRLLLLERLFEHMRQRQDVWFATCRDVAQWTLKEYGNG